MSKWHKIWLYSVSTEGLIGMAWWLTSAFTLEDAAPFLRALRFLTAIGVLLVSVCICNRRRSDALFIGIIGGITMGVGILLLLLYGGMDDPTFGGDTAMNILSCLWTALPLAFAVRTLVLVAGTWDDSRSRHRIACGLVAILFLGMTVLILTGQMLHFVHLSPVE